MQNGDPQARALAEKVDQMRKAAVIPETPGVPAVSQRDGSHVNPPVQATGQREFPRTPSPGRRGSPPAPEQGLLAELRVPEPGLLPAVTEKPDEDMDDVNGEPPNQEETPGAVADDVAMAVEEARKRVHAALDAG
eukprot:2079788-Amphidinium_carterae.1